MNYPKKTGFNLYQSRHCVYITYSVKNWFLKFSLYVRTTPRYSKKLIKGKTLNEKSKSGNTGFDDVTRNGGMSNGRDVADQRIDLSTKA